jgi:hypothetical protein
MPLDPFDAILSWLKDKKCDIRPKDVTSVVTRDGSKFRLAYYLSPEPHITVFAEIPDAWENLGACLLSRPDMFEWLEKTLRLPPD